MNKFIYLITIFLLVVAGIQLFFDQKSSYKALKSTQKVDQTSSPYNLEFSEFKNWKQKFGKQYLTQDEDQYRFSVYLKNKEFVEKYNKEKGDEYVTLNHLSDITNEEYQALYLNKIKQESFKNQKNDLKKEKLKKYDNSDLPSQVDWRKEGAVTPVQDIRKCEGASVAFSVAGAMEGLHKIKTGKLVELSAQQLISCDRNNYGCDGGEEIISYIYTLNYGIMTAESFPYKSGTWGDTGFCSYDVNDVVFQNTNAYKIQFNNPWAIEKYLAQQPLSSGIDASSDSYRFYNGKKVFTDNWCGNEINDSVLMVGYNNDAEVPYWIIKNSIGTHWGDQGYMYLKKDMSETDGVCGINEDTTFPAWD